MRGCAIKNSHLYLYLHLQHSNNSCDAVIVFFRHVEHILFVSTALIMSPAAGLPPTNTNGHVPNPRTLADIDAEVLRRVNLLGQVPLYTLIQNANSSFQLARNQLTYGGRGREREEEAYMEFAVASNIIFNQVPRNRDYPSMVSGTSRNNEQYKALKKNISQCQAQFQTIRSSIAQPVQPQQQQQSTTNGTNTPDSMSSPKSKPMIRPKPDSLIGNPVDHLAARFAALRNQSTPSPVQMPDAADYMPKPAGPRQMPAKFHHNTPAPPPKIPLITNLPPSMLRPPSPAYSPARNMQTPASVDPPRTTPRSIVGTGGRSNSYQASITSPIQPFPPFQAESYFPPVSTTSTDSSRRKGIVGLPTETTITPDRLFDFLKLYDVLLVDVRSRQAFDEGHIDSANIICVEPLQLRPGISALDIQSSLSIAPDEEDVLFGTRHLFNLVVYYDQSSKSPNFLSSPKTNAEEKLRILHEALVDYNIDKPLMNSPMLLAGGLDAWIALLGYPSLQTSRTQLGRPRRLSSLPSSLVVGKRRVRQFNPLNPEEEKEWAERARSESVHIPDVPEEDLVAEDEEPDTPDLETNTTPFYRSEDEFHRRYPEIHSSPESMVVAPPRQSSLSSNQPITYARRPVSSSSSAATNGYRHQNHPEMPSRPAPTANKVSYSGAHDLNALPPSNAVRSRYLPPSYISPQEKPGNIPLPRVGLRNFGATCYMNSIIQCMSATVPLSRYFKEGAYRKFVQRDNWKGSRGVLPDLYANLIHNLWLKTDDPYQSIRPVTFRVSAS
jgi:ubiquitin carboxyl-terminal hydrolase 8